MVDWIWGRWEKRIKDEYKDFLLSNKEGLAINWDGKTGRSYLVGAIQELNIGSVKLKILLNIWMYILDKHWSYLFKYSFSSFHLLLEFWLCTYFYSCWYPKCLWFLVIFLLVLFFVCFILNNLIWPIIKFTDFLANSDLHLSPSRGFFILAIILFSFRISIQLVFITFIPYWYSLFVDMSYTYFLKFLDIISY